MEKKLSTQIEKEIDWLKNEVEKDKLELEREKMDLINSIKKIDKKEIIQPKQKLTLWKKIKKVLLNQ
jgi:hypothetical protein